MNIGAIIPAGLDLEGLGSFLTDTNYAVQGGGGPFELYVVPEPSSLVLLVAGAAFGLLMMIRRRRKAGR